MFLLSFFSVTCNSPVSTLQTVNCNLAVTKVNYIAQRLLNWKTHWSFQKGFNFTSEVWTSFLFLRLTQMRQLLHTDLQNKIHMDRITRILIFGINAQVYIENLNADFEITVWDVLKLSSRYMRLVWDHL